MSFISAGIAAAGLATSIASQAGLFGGKGGGAPAFDYRSGDLELQKLREQIAKRDEYDRLEAEERARQRGLVGTERGRQAAFTDETNKSLGSEIARYDDIPGQLAARGQQLADYFGTNSAAAPVVLPTARSETTARHTADKLADSAAFNTQQNTALAKVRSLGDLFGDISRESLRDKTHMTNVADFKQGSKALLPAEIRPIVNRQAPQITAGNFGQFYGPPEAPDTTVSDIANGVGRIGLAYGLSGGNPFGGGFSGTPQGLIEYGSPGFVGSRTYGGPR